MLLFFLINNAVWLLITHVVLKLNYFQTRFNTKFVYTAYTSVIIANLLYVLIPPIDGYPVFIITALDCLFMLYAIRQIFGVSLLNPMQNALETNKYYILFERCYDLLFGLFLMLYTCITFYNFHVPVLNIQPTFNPIDVIVIFALIKSIADYKLKPRKAYDK